ncbi:hypothetical protein [Polyangium spumosum]|uniref:Uncharacterized protein n=1 Tax=Polyangium spumosum TaxID=889282 RepID=A0A6N7Q148_9BACT|nr:hypothetical protein [Polyangium spumosum]MRG98038.1 hypothetical protein [Polyangium spumosum]
MNSFTTSPTPPSTDDGAISSIGSIAACQVLALRAYFATKVVTETDGTTTVRLDRIYTHVLGRVVYVVVECTYVWHGASVTIKLRTNDERLTGVSQQVLRVTDGTADVESFTARVGETSALNDNTGACAYNNLVEFNNKAIFKLTLRPHARAEFDVWAEHIQDAGRNLPSIGIELSCAWESFSFTNAVEFPLTIENKKVYEIHHRDNTYNFLPTYTDSGRTVRKKISHIENDFTDRVKYYFFNRIDNCHEICEVPQTSVRRRANGQTVTGTAVPAGHIESHAAPGGDADTNYYYNQPATPPDMTTKDPRWLYFGIVTTGKPGTTYGIKRYDLASPNNPLDMVDLVQMPNDLNYDAETGTNRVWATFAYENTERRSCNPGCFAGFLGALIQLGRGDIVCTGMCFDDATSYPSVTHPNGDSADTLYLTTQADEQLKVNALRDHYFARIRRGSSGWKGGLQHTVYTPFHEDHLHAEDFDVARVVVLNP